MQPAANDSQALSSFCSKYLRLYVIFCAYMVCFGMLLDATKNLGNQNLWRLSWLLILIIGAWKCFLTKSKLTKIGLSFVSIKKWFLLLNFGERIFVFTTLIITGFNLYCCIALYPFNWDSMTYHLTRVMYFIQHQNTDFFESNFYAQVVYPVYGSYLHIAFLMLFGDERSMNLVQYIGGLFAALSVVGIALQGNGRRAPFLAVGCIFLNLTIVNLQMTTTQNDLLMASLLGCCIYFIILWIKDRKSYSAFYGSLSIAICLGIKASAFMYFPPLCIVLITYLHMSRSVRKIYHISISFILILFVFLTAGYFENVMRFGNALGDKSLVSAVMFDKELSSTNKFKFGLKNTVRYSSQFISLDGLPPVDPITNLHKVAQKLFIYPFQVAGIDVYDDEAVRRSFYIDKPQAHECQSYWGILGVLVLPPVFLAICLKRFRRFLPLSLGTVAFLLTQSFAGQYDPWRGRLFIACAVFAVPSTVVLWELKEKTRTFTLILSLLLIVASLSSVSTLVLRKNRPVMDIHYRDKNWKSVFRMDRVEQLTANRVTLTEPVRKAIEWIDRHPNLKLYTIFGEDFYEYPFFRGNEVIPLNGFVSGFEESKLNCIRKGILIYSGEIYTSYKVGDIEFGANLFGRVI